MSDSEILTDCLRAIITLCVVLLIALGLFVAIWTWKHESYQCSVLMQLQGRTAELMQCLMERRGR